MVDLIRLRRWIRMLGALCASLTVFAAAGWLRGRSADPAEVALGSAEDVEALRQRISAAGHAERIRLLHAIGRNSGAPATRVVIEMLRAAQSDRERQAAIAQLGLLGTPEALDELVELVRAGRPALGHLAVSALGQARSAGAAERLEELLGESEGPRLRRQLVRALGECGGDSAAATLAGMSQDPREPARLAAIFALGRTGSEQALQPLVALTRSGPVAVRRAALSGLGELGAPEAKQLLIQLVQTGPAMLRDAALEALGHYPGDDVQILLAGMARSADGRVAAAALRALGEDDGPLARDALAAALRSDRAQTRRAAVRALGRSGDPEARETLIALLEDPALAATAAEQLGSMDDPAAQQALLQVARADAPIALQRAALAALSRTPGSEDLDQALGELARSGHPAVAASALRQLARRQGPAARELLLQAYRDGTPATRAAALGALAAQGGQGIRGMLRDAARSGDDALSDIAIRELFKLEGAESRSLMIGIVQRAGGSGQFAAADALAAMGGAESRAALLEAFKQGDSSSHVRWALGSLNDEETRRQLGALLDDKDLSERKKRETVEMLKRSGDAERLLAAAGHHDEEVAAPALEALGSIGGAVAERALLDAAASPDARRRDAALEALGELGTPKAIEALSRALHDEQSFDTAIAELANVGGKQAMEVLSGHYRAASAEQREEIVSTLSGTTDPRGRSLLLSALDDQQSEVVRAAAAALSSGCTDPQVKQRLFHLMQTSPDPAIRHGVALRLSSADQKLYREHRAIFDRILSEG